MKEDFFSVTAPMLSRLNDSDRRIYDYISKNIHTVKDESIRALAHDCFVSTTTLFRFVQKLGFTGYADFLNLLRLTDYMQDSQEHLPAQPSGIWENAYLARVEETIQCITEENAQKLLPFLRRDSTVVLISDEYCYEAARYARRMLSAHGIRVEVPMFSYEYPNISGHLKKNDILWVFSLKSQEGSLLECIERMRAYHDLKVIAFMDTDDAMLRRISDFFFSFPIGGEPEAEKHSLVPLMIGIDQLSHYYRCKADSIAEGE